MFNKYLYKFSFFLAFFLSPAVPSFIQAQTISTTAGNGIQGFAGDGGNPTDANLVLPTAAWGDTSGTLYIADTGNHRIRKISTAGVITTFAGTGNPGFSGDNGQAASAQLDAPSGVFVDSIGNVYIADTGNHRIRKIAAADSTISTIAGKDTTAGLFIDDTTAVAATLNGPSGVFVDGIGNIYIADTGNHRIRKVTTAGTISTIAGKDTTAGLFIDDTTAVAATLNGPSGVFVDGIGNIYIADTGNHRIRKIAAADSTISTLAGSDNPGFTGDGGLPTNARLSFPSAVIADSLGIFYIADRFNHRIRRINPSGNITTIAGTDDFGFSGDGSAANISELASPSGLFLGRNDTLYICDTSNHRIRRIVPDDTQGSTGINSMGPGNEVQLLSTALTGDDRTTVKGLTFTISDLSSPSGFTIADLVEFHLWESSDDSLSSDDSQIGSLTASAVSLGTQATIEATTFPKPSLGTLRYYLLSARIAKTATQGRSFRTGVETGALTTSQGGRGSRVIASDSSRITIDVTATKLVFTQHPANSLSGAPFSVQPIVSAVDDSGLVDLDFIDTITISTNGTGTLLHNRSTALDGVATFTNLTYSTSIDDEQILLFADDESGGISGDLEILSSNTLAINVVNDPPTVDFPPLVFKEDDPIGFRTPISAIVSDPDDTTFEFTFSSNHILAGITTTNDSIYVLPEPDWFGIDTLTVSATDGFGLSHSDQSIIEVQPVNDSPKLLLADALVFTEDDTLTLDLKEEVEDLDNAYPDLIWKIVPSSGLASVFSPDTGQLQLWSTPDTSGSFSLTLEVRDPEQLFDRDTLHVEILPANDPPVFSLPDATILQGATLEIDLVSATIDRDHSSAEMSWSAAADSIVAIEIIGGQALLTPATKFSGTRELSFTAMDPAGGQSTASFRLTVLRVNQHPELSGLPDTTLAPGDNLTLDLSLFASDADDSVETLIWSITGGSRITTIIQGSVLTLSIPSDNETYSESIAVRVFDLFGATAYDTFAVDVEAILPPIAGLPDIEFEAARTFDLDLIPYLNGAPTTLSALSDSNLQVLIDLEKKRASFSSIDGWKGSTFAVFEALNKRGIVVADTMSITVTNPPPTVENLPEVFLDAGLSTQIALDDYARDDEDTALLTWTALPDPGLQIGIHSILHRATIIAGDHLSGMFRVVFQAIDAQGASGSDTLRIYVHRSEQSSTTLDTTGNDTTEGNSPPTFYTIPTLSFESEKNGILALDRYVDDDGPLSSLTWSATADPETLLEIEIDSTRTATVSALQDSGRGSIVLQVNDPEGLKSLTEVEVVIHPQPVLRPGDFNRDEHIDLSDFFRFVDAFGLTKSHPDWDSIFDLNDDGHISFDDYFLFIDAFSASNART